MTLDAMGAQALDYLPCRYGNSKLLFRGPRRDLSEPYIAFLGANETYGKFIETPFVAMLEEDLSMTCANFGCLNAGVDVFLHDPFVPDATAKARLTVLQVPCAQNLSNRFYTVHPRRNDRFVSATKMLQAIYPDVDFAKFHFNKHMLGALKQMSEERFWLVEQELRQAWIARMRTLMERISGKVVLTWISARAPNDLDRIDVEPMHVTGEMLELVRPHATEYVEVKLSPEALENPLNGMIYSQMDAPAAQEMLGLKAHREISQTLGPVLKRMVH
ncbi:hypothetical protein E4Z66_14450 [Aliishimia ponticola]|uniref:DUF6473 domain-containing protein n=2 Tax=Aliishimia ponticola TaxID=2499833 RepID=A0A4S4NG42_9RHOB|nr:DUF6473 family protein [Aliishimia ponticola]THH35030.1 hypothetical protein E4Z66_14450 [Aliishimia ponticola]